MDGREVAGKPGAHLDQIDGDEAADILVLIDHRALHRLRHGHGRRRRRRLLLTLTAAGKGTSAQQHRKARGVGDGHKSSPLNPHPTLPRERGGSSLIFPPTRAGEDCLDFPSPASGEDSLNFPPPRAGEGREGASYAVARVNLSSDRTPHLPSPARGGGFCDLSLPRERGRVGWGQPFRKPGRLPIWTIRSQLRRIMAGCRANRLTFHEDRSPERRRLGGPRRRIGPIRRPTRGSGPARRLFARRHRRGRPRRPGGGRACRSCPLPTLPRARGRERRGRAAAPAQASSWRRMGSSSPTVTWPVPATASK